MPEQSRQNTSSERKLAAIMFTDIVGYTALMQQDEKQALKLVRENLIIQKPLIETHHGKLLKEMGDGTMSSFPNVLDAIKCAIKIQQAASIEFEGKLRIGIHVGDITMEDGEIYGDGVNIASRIESLADPGGVYVSESVIKSIEGQTTFEPIYLGEYELKNVSGSQRIFAIKGFGLPEPAKSKAKISFWDELIRRNVLRAGLAYALVSAILIQALSFLGVIQDFRGILLIVLIAGLPAALIFAWFFERGPEGFIRTTSIASYANPYSASGKKPFTSNTLIIVLISALVLLSLASNFRTGGAEKSAVSSNLKGIADNTLAVLYFENMSGDEGQDYFSDGVTEEIISHLAKIEGLKVRSRTTVMKYKEKRGQKSIPEIAQELKVAAILEGSIRRSGNQVRITALLLNGATDEHLWSRDYNFKMDDIFAIQSSVAREIAAQFEVEITPEVELKLNTPPTLNSRAYDLYLQARAIWWQDFGIGNEPVTRRKAEKLLKEAIRLDPQFVEAHALLSQVFVMNWRSLASSKNWIDSALILANTAVALNP
ncbi:MAG: hypothetical protein O7F74_06585, partial [Bacteroidetes bacterium]|nr:hypothetical protein [Bacteroidota bacterium]